MLIKMSRYFHRVYSSFSKITVCIFFVSLLQTTTWAQSTDADSMMSIDLLLPPSSPGFVLLGIEPASVERPGTVTDLGFSILSATNNINLLPKNFALEFAPYWLFFGKNISYETYAHSQDISSTILQTASISLATSQFETIPDSLTTSMAWGLRFSILRGDIDPGFDNYAANLDSLYKVLGKLTEQRHDEWVRREREDEVIKSLDSLFRHSDPVSKPLIEPIIEAQINQRVAEIKQEVEAEQSKELNNIKQIISELRLRRIGWKLDIAGGVAVRFPQGVFDDARVSRWGAWLTSGYEWQNLSILSVFRYLDGDSEVTESSVDVGGRIILDNFERFSLSAESLYRKFLENNTDNDQWRSALIIDYALAKNKLVSLTFGRNFNGNQSRNLITSVSLLMGFGSTRPIR